MKNKIKKLKVDEIPNFMIMGDKNFFEVIKISINKINRLYPKSKIYIYDLGMRHDMYNDLESMKNVKVVKWQLKDVFSPPLFDNIKAMIKRRSLNPSFERKSRQKPHCIKHCIENYADNLIYIDGDAVIVRKIDEIVNGDFDIALTVRGCGPNSILSGCIFLKGGKEKNLKFLNEWLKQMPRCKEHGGDQVSLGELVEKGIDGIKFDFFSVRKYNYWHLKDLKIPSYVKIIHLKGTLHHTRWLKKLKKIIEEVK